MSNDLDTPPPARRFGPVTLLALAGGMVLGLLGVAVAWQAGRPEMMRGILVAFVFAGVLGGVVAGAVVERRLRAPRALGRFPWHWFRFDLRLAMATMTAVAIYCGAGAALGRLWIGSGKFFFIGLLNQLPAIVFYLLAALVFFNRRQLHPRATRFALAGLSWMLAVSLITPFEWVLQMSWSWNRSINSSTPPSLYIFWILFLAKALVRYGGLFLLCVAVLVDRGVEPAAPEERPGE